MRDSNNIIESEGGDHVAELNRKKGKKPKPLKWRSTNSDMNNRRDGEAEEGSDGGRDDGDDTVLSSLTRSTTGCGSLVGRKRARTLGKVAEDCDAVDPPVPRKLRSGTTNPCIWCLLKLAIGTALSLSLSIFTY
uniref:Predicted protein n=1 Tax=Hordeum vulgare subsp. vulgare TaxID=112509 RepID=F2EL02_HORVV|nr:predicted protein [Hordeum vulgare subsp. vulgare]